MKVEKDKIISSKERISVKKKVASAKEPKIKDEFLPATSDTKEWTVLAYLMPNHLEKLRQLEKVGSDNKVNIVAYIPLATGEGYFARRYYVNKAKEASYIASSPSDVVAEGPAEDFGSTKTLEDFLEWGIKKYPAKHYLVIMQNHGDIWLGGWRDEGTGNMLTLPEIDETLKKVENNTGKKIDVLSMDACLMANLENAYEIKDRADILLASENLEYVQLLSGYSGVPLDKTLRGIGKKTPKELAIQWVEKSEGDRGSPTQSAIDLKKIEMLAKASSNLAKALLDSSISIDLLRNIVKDSFSMATSAGITLFSYQKDLASFAKKLLENKDINDNKVREAAKEVLDSIKEVVIAEQDNEQEGKELGGISVYIPTEKEGVEKPWELFKKDVSPVSDEVPYKELKFAKDTLWDEFFTKISLPYSLPAPEAPVFFPPADDSIHPPAFPAQIFPFPRSPNMDIT